MAKSIVTEIRKATRRKFSAEEKIRIVMEGLRGEIRVSELARRAKLKRRTLARRRVRNRTIPRTVSQPNS